jgi:hypothetical protein
MVCSGFEGPRLWNEAWQQQLKYTKYPRQFLEQNDYNQLSRSTEDTKWQN